MARRSYFHLITLSSIGFREVVKTNTVGWVLAVMRSNSSTLYIS